MSPLIKIDNVFYGSSRAIMATYACFGGTYLALMPYEIQMLICQYEHALTHKDMHDELYCELSNDIPPSNVLVQDNPTLFMRKLHEVVDIIAYNSRSKFMTLPYIEYHLSLRGYLVTYFRSGRGDMRYDNMALLFDARGRDIYSCVSDMITGGVWPGTVVGSYNALLCIENNLCNLSYGELCGVKHYLVKCSQI